MSLSIEVNPHLPDDRFYVRTERGAHWFHITDSKEESTMTDHEQFSEKGRLDRPTGPMKKGKLQCRLKPGHAVKPDGIPTVKGPDDCAACGDPLHAKRTVMMHPDTGEKVDVCSDCARRLRRPNWRCNPTQAADWYRSAVEQGYGREFG